MRPCFASMVFDMKIVTNVEIRESSKGVKRVYGVSRSKRAGQPRGGRAEVFAYPQSIHVAGRRNFVCSEPCIEVLRHRSRRIRRGIRTGKSRISHPGDSGQ